MGFLGILGKKKDKKAPLKEELAMPPPPPLSSSDLYSELPSFPGAPPTAEEVKLPLPLKPLATKAPKAEEVDWSERLPETRPFKPIVEEEPLKEFEAPMPEEIEPEEKEAFPEVRPEIVEIETEPKERIRREELEETFTPERPLFLKAYRFRAVIENIESMTDSLTGSLSAFTELKNAKEVEEKEYEKWRNGLEEIQRKLVLVDNMLFEM